MNVLRAKREGLFAGGQSLVVLTRSEVDFCLGEPSLEASRVGGHRRLQLRQSGRLFAHREIESRLLRQGQSTCVG